MYPCRAAKISGVRPLELMHFTVSEFDDISSFTTCMSIIVSLNTHAARQKQELVVTDTGKDGRTTGYKLMLQLTSR